MGAERDPRTNMSPTNWPNMAGQTVRCGHCAVCGSPGPGLSQHPVVAETAGELYRAGVRLPKPSVTLCPSCRELAETFRLHFRWVDTRQRPADLPEFSIRGRRGVRNGGSGHWECLRTYARISLREAGEVEHGWRRCA